jgi:hypothetical protein
MSSGIRGLFFVTVVRDFRMRFGPVVRDTVVPREKHPRRSCQDTGAQLVRVFVDLHALLLLDQGVQAAKE